MNPITREQIEKRKREAVDIVTNATINAFFANQRENTYFYREPPNTVALYGITPQPTMEQQYNKMQEEVSKLVGIVNNVQKELVETRKENEEVKQQLSKVTKKKQVKIKEVRRSEVKKIIKRLDRLEKELRDFAKEYHEGMEDMPLVREVGLALRDRIRALREENNGQKTTRNSTTDENTHRFNGT